MSADVNVIISVANLLVLLGALHKMSRWMGEVDSTIEHYRETFTRVERELERLHGRISRMKET